MFGILKIIIILYLILLVPLMLGILWQRYVTKQRLEISVFVQGWLCMMALFYCEAVPMILFKMSLTNLKNIWLATAIIITILFLMTFFRTREEWKAEKKERKIGRGILVMFLVVICSILFVKPQTYDDTIEVVMEAYMTDTMYQYQPYTGEMYLELPEEKAYSPIEMYYAVLSNMVNAHPAIVVKILIPMGFLVIFMFNYIMWAKILFEKNKKLQEIFLFFIGIIFLLPVISKKMEMFAIWQSCWRGEILLTTTVLPLECYYVYKMIDEVSHQCRRRNMMEHGGKLLIAAIVAQLVYPKGMFFSSIIILVGIVIIAARRFQEKYAANTNNN